MITLLKSPITYLILIIIALSLYIIFRPAASNNDIKIIQDEQKYDSLNTVNKKKMDSISSYYQDKIDSLDYRMLDAENDIRKNNLLIESLQNAYNKEVPVINSFDVDALQQYLSNYKQQSDTTAGTGK